MPRTNQTLVNTLQQIEIRLAGFYDFEIQSSAVDHLVDHEALQDFAPELQPTTHRAAVVSVIESEEAFVGLFVSEEIRDKVESAEALDRLDNDNLDSFCVLVEEVSHFHLLMQRIQRNIPISQLELEWQGEVDKFLIAASLLFQQTQNPHFQPLFELIFERFNFSPCVDVQRYQIANFFAAKFWNRILTALDHPLSRNQSVLKSILRSAYRAGLPEKFNLSESFRRAA